jgi:hypothetical protein
VGKFCWVSVRVKERGRLTHGGAEGCLYRRQRVK